MDPTKTPQQDNPENPNEDLADERQQRTDERRRRQSGRTPQEQADRTGDTEPGPRKAAD